MQVLKEDIRKRILDAARSQFTSYGFANAAMKDIATEAGITVGNLYRYYPGKDDLFVAVVTPAIAAVNDLIATTQPPDSEEPTDFEQFRQAIAERTLRLFLLHHIELQLLLRGAAQSSMENMRQHVVEALSAKIKQHVLKLVPSADRNDTLMLFFELVANAYISSIADILLHTDPQQDQTNIRYLLMAVGELYFRNLRDLIIQLLGIKE